MVFFTCTCTGVLSFTCTCSGGDEERVLIDLLCKTQNQTSAVQIKFIPTTCSMTLSPCLQISKHTAVVSLYYSHIFMFQRTVLKSIKNKTSDSELEAKRQYN